MWPFRRKVGLRIETWMGAGRYQHQVYDIGVSPKDGRKDAVSEEVVEALKMANERL